MKVSTSWVTGILCIMIVAAVMSCTNFNNEEQTMKKDWAIAIHGGAGVISKDMPDSVKQAYRDDLSEALAIGEEILGNGGAAVDAVEQVINYLENNPKFNAGKGAVFTHEGEHELDAAIMIGNTLEAGTITGVKTVKNPISLARHVMENSKHVMFAAGGAEEYAELAGVERVDQEYYYTEKRYKSWKRALQEEEETQEQSLKLDHSGEAELWDEHKFGTVGCVAVDKKGQIVAGTSTGGMTNKKYGRVGDVPIVGAGTYANDLVAVSMTGWGEKIMLHVSGHTVGAYMKFKNASLEEAGDYLINRELAKDVAGMIAVDSKGNTYMNMNTQGMFRGAADSEGYREVAIWKE